MNDKEEILKIMEKLKGDAIKCMEKGEWLLASQYLLDMNNLLPAKYRVRMSPPPRPEEYY